MDRMDGRTTPRCLYFSACEKALYFLEQLEQYSIIESWANWEVDVQEVLRRSDEYKEIRLLPDTDRVHTIKATRLFKQYILKYLPKEKDVDFNDLASVFPGIFGDRSIEKDSLFIRKVKSMEFTAVDLLDALVKYHVT